jgi:hypothetical protein
MDFRVNKNLNYYYADLVTDSGVDLILGAACMLIVS